VCGRWLPSQVYRDAQHAAAGIEYLMKQFDLSANPRTNAFVCGIEEKPTRRLVGHVGLSPLFDTVEVGFGVAQAEQGKGYATEAVTKICAWALEYFPLASIIGVTDAENVASRRVLIRSSFRWKEERMMRFQGADRPVVIYEIMKNWPDLRWSQPRDRSRVERSALRARSHRGAARSQT